MDQPKTVPSDLHLRECEPIPKGAAALKANEVSELIGSLHGWEIEGEAIVKTFKFGNYHETMAFVNASAWVSHRQDHHPDLEVGYDRCRVRYSTHSVGGLSENDFICAARLDALVGG